MEADFIKQLIELGSLGIFAGFLVWQHNTLQKRLDKLTDTFRAEVRELEDRHEAAEQTIRDRFDATMARYEGQRERVFSEVVSTLSDHDKQLGEVTTLLETGLAEMRQHYAEQRLKEISRAPSE